MAACSPRIKRWFLISLFSGLSLLTAASNIHENSWSCCCCYRPASIMSIGSTSTHEDDALLYTTLDCTVLLPHYPTAMGIPAIVWDEMGVNEWNVHQLQIWPPDLLAGILKNQSVMDFNLVCNLVRRCERILALLPTRRRSAEPAAVGRIKQHRHLVNGPG